MKLHLGCGHKILDGYVNVDIKGEVDVLHNLEIFPYPFEDNSVDEIKMEHVLEHLGQHAQVYFNVWKELYRISKHGCILDIVVPHPRHDNFINDPTHVRIVTPEGLSMFSKKFNRHCIENKFSNSTFGLDLNIDFEIEDVETELDTNWSDSFGVKFGSKHYNNVVSQYEIKMKAIKDGN